MARGYCGVYAIVNTLNNKVYIGSTIHRFSLRFATHRHLLVRGKHHSIHLQRAWNKYGAENFSFRILETCDEDQCLIRELFYINKFDSYKNGYNRCPTPYGSRGLKFSPESKAKMAKAHLGIKHSEETKAKMSESAKGVSKTEEHKQNLWKNRQGWKHSEESKAKTSATLQLLIASGKTIGWKKGHKHSVEAKEKMSKARKGKAKSLEHRAKIAAANKAFHLRRKQLKNERRDSETT